MPSDGVEIIIGDWKWNGGDFDCAISAGVGSTFDYGGKIMEFKRSIKDFASSRIIEEDSISKIFLTYIQHNKRHFIELNFFGKVICPCARCFGYWLGAIVGFLVSLPFWLGFLQAHNFLLIFTIAWLFVVPSIIDWSTVKLGFRKGNNTIRVIVGYLHGISVIIYFFILPASLIFKISTYTLYGSIFFIIRRYFQIKHYHFYDNSSLNQ